jgi:hypothetical protein
MLAGWINDRPNAPERQLKQFGSDDHSWLAIRTKVEEPSD